VLAVLWPLSRARAVASARDADLAVYRDQLAEIERDGARGLIAAPEAEAARIEVSRRLIAAGGSTAETVAAGKDFRRRSASIAALAGIPVIALGLYAAVGSPDIPDAPLQARLEKPPEQQDVAILVRRIETHLAANPNDARGWDVLAPIYLRMGRPQDAVNARANILRILGPDAAREADLGEALAAAADGIVNEEARAAFERALALDKANPKARFFVALAAEQDGRRDEAFSVWKALATEAASADPHLEAWRLAAARRADRLQAERKQ
jgi:cytochrome c-type biogenesis protein CcmH